MASSLKRSNGAATIAGTTIFTVQADTVITIIGIRAANTDNVNEHTVSVTVGGRYASAKDTPLPVGSAIELMEGGKIIAEAGDTIVATADTDNDVDIIVSYLFQTL